MMVKLRNLLCRLSPIKMIPNNVQIIIINKQKMKRRENYIYLKSQNQTKSMIYSQTQKALFFLLLYKLRIYSKSKVLEISHSNSFLKVCLAQDRELPIYALIYSNQEIHVMIGFNIVYVCSSCSVYGQVSRIFCNRCW